MNSFFLVRQLGCVYLNFQLCQLQLDKQRPFWLALMKVEMLPCYTHVFAFGSSLNNVDSSK